MSARRQPVTRDEMRAAPKVTAMRNTTQARSKDTGGVYLDACVTPVWARRVIAGYVHCGCHRSDARHDREHHPRRTESIAYQVNDLPVRHETRYRHCPLLPFCGRRCRPRQLPDAVPGDISGLHDSPSSAKRGRARACYLAGLATGVWRSREELKQPACDTLYAPSMDE